MRRKDKIKKRLKILSQAIGDCLSNLLSEKKPKWSGRRLTNEG